VHINIQMARLKRNILFSLINSKIINSIIQVWIYIIIGNDILWNKSVFNINSQSLFGGYVADKRLCVSLVGLIKWGEAYIINL